MVFVVLLLHSGQSIMTVIAPRLCLKSIRAGVLLQVLGTFAGRKAFAISP